MLQLTVIIILLIAVVLLYGSNKHQRLLNKKVPTSVRPFAWLLISISLIIAFYALDTTAAIFFSIFILMLTLMVIPFISLLNTKENNK